MKKLNNIFFKNYKYSIFRGENFYHNFFFENYKIDINTYWDLEQTNYKVFVNSMFFKKTKLFSSRHFDYLNKNKLNVDKFLNMTFSRGEKLKFLKSINYAVNMFYFSFIQKSSFLQNKFDNYSLFYNFSKENEFFFNFDFILNNIVTLNESIFIIKVLKLNKKNKKRLKKKYDFEVRYLQKQKRAGNVLKAVHLMSNSYNYYRYCERILASLFTSFFLQKASRIYKKKIFAYSSILKNKSL